jgi:hypothetical protein
VRRSRAARVTARLGLVARGVFYLVLALLAAGVAADGGSRTGPANAHGALTTVAGNPLGELALVAAAVGFAAFGLQRLAGAYADRNVGRWRRLTTAGQALAYLAMAAAIARFLLGARSTGSSRQEDSTAAALVSSAPGQVLLAVVGLVTVGVCLWQLYLAVRGGFADSLDTSGLGRRTRRWAVVVGALGIAARATAVLPTGVLLVVAALWHRPSEARDLDELLHALARHPLGHVMVWCLAVGLAVFALYSFLEAPLRRVHAGD